MAQKHIVGVNLCLQLMQTGKSGTRQSMQQQFSKLAACLESWNGTTHAQKENLLCFFAFACITLYKPCNKQDNPL